MNLHFHRKIIYFKILEPVCIFDYSLVTNFIAVVTDDNKVLVSDQGLSDQLRLSDQTLSFDEVFCIHHSLVVTGACRSM